MTDTRTFTVPGKPTGKGRPRATIRGGHAAMYTPAKTASYENKVALSYVANNPNAKPFAAVVALQVSIVATFAIPKSWSKKRKAEAMWHTGKPDADNLIKCLDALNGVAWHDDSQVAFVSCSKRYDRHGQGESLTVTIKPLNVFNTN